MAYIMRTNFQATIEHFLNSPEMRKFISNVCLFCHSMRSPLCRSLSGIAKHQPRHNNWTTERCRESEGKTRNALKHNLSARCRFPILLPILYPLGLLGMLWPIDERITYPTTLWGLNDAVCVCFMECFSAHLRMARDFHFAFSATMRSGTHKKWHYFLSFFHSIAFVTKYTFHSFIRFFWSRSVRCIIIFGRHGNSWLGVCVFVNQLWKWKR